MIPKVSIIVPVYNVQNYINRCLKSLVNQTLDDLEIIIVNDGSTDFSKEIINKYMEKYQNKIRYFEKENGGLSSARNFGIKYATGKYIAFLDSDDYVEKDMYKTMYEVAEKENSEMVECDFIWEYMDKKIFDKRRNYKNKREIMKKPRVVAWNKLIKSEIIKSNEIFFPDGLIYEDIEFFYKLLPHINKISYVQKNFVHYVQRKDSLSNKQDNKTNDIFYILKNVLEYYKKMGLYKEYNKELNYMVRRICLGSSLKRILKIKDKKLKNNLLLRTLYFLIFKKIKERKKNIVFGITKLDIGGAERVLVDMVNKLVEEYNITIFTIYSNGRLEKELNKNINVINLYKKQNVFTPIFLLLFGRIIYRKYLKNKFEIEVAFLEGPITRIFKYKDNSKKIAWVHNDIKNVFGSGIKSWIKKEIDKYVYKKYDTIIFVSEENRKSFNNLYGNKFNEKVIYNYIDIERIKKFANEKIKKEDIFEGCRNNKILTIARLTKQKGIDRLIRVHKKIIDNGINHKIFVIGDGEERKNLENEIKKFEVQNSFILLGAKENPYPYLKECDLFVLLSYYEGYGMVLEEAKIFDKPIVITNTAAKEAVRNYDNSIIVENNEEAIFQGLKKMLERKDK